MEKEKKNYIVGPPIKVQGLNRSESVERAMRKLGLPTDKFSVALVATIPVTTKYGEYHIICHDMNDLKLLPADFAERIQEEVDPKLA